jgi:hypothetical protein
MNDTPKHRKTIPGDGAQKQHFIQTTAIPGVLADSKTIHGVRARKRDWAGESSGEE